MKILIVDDDVELVGLLRFALHGAGYDVVTAFDGDQALARFVGSSRVDLQACKLEYSIVSPK